MQKYILSIDQGTTSSRCIIFDQHGQIKSFHQKEHSQFYPAPGWVEHDPEEIWLNCVQTIHEAMQKARLESTDIQAIGITNQRETVVAWNRNTGLPYANAIVWQDTRTAADCNSIIQNSGQDYLRSKTGLPIAAYFSLTKILWLLNTIPGLRKDAEKGAALFGTIDSWLIWNLTGGNASSIFATDPTNASRTQIMNINTLGWDSDIAKEFEIPLQSLPKIQPSISFFGECKTVLIGVPVYGVLGDQQSALFGQTCFDPGEAKNTYGTGCFLLMNTGEKPVLSKHGLLTTIACQFEKQKPIYALEGSIAVTGSLVQWLRDNLNLIKESSEIESLALSVKDNGDVYFVPAFSGLFAPYWRMDARGIIAGLTRYSHAGHIARAALEATAYQTREVMEAMQKDSNIPLSQLKVDGGMVKNRFLMQFQADQLQVPVQSPLIIETTASGAAFAAGLGSGYWSSLADLKELSRSGTSWTPKMKADESDRLYGRWQQAVQKSMNWV